MKKLVLWIKSLFKRNKQEKVEDVVTEVEVLTKVEDVEAEPVVLEPVVLEPVVEESSAVDDVCYQTKVEEPLEEKVEEKKKTAAEIKSKAKTKKQQTDASKEVSDLSEKPKRKYNRKKK